MGSEQCQGPAFLGSWLLTSWHSLFQWRMTASTGASPPMSFLFTRCGHPECGAFPPPGAALSKDRPEWEDRRPCCLAPSWDHSGTCSMLSPPSPRKDWVLVAHSGYLLISVPHTTSFSSCLLPPLPVLPGTTCSVNDLCPSPCLRICLGEPFYALPWGALIHKSDVQLRII